LELYKWLICGCWALDRRNKNCTNWKINDTWKIFSVCCVLIFDWNLVESIVETWDIVCPEGIIITWFTMSITYRLLVAVRMLYNKCGYRIWSSHFLSVQNLNMLFFSSFCCFVIFRIDSSLVFFFSRGRSWLLPFWLPWEHWHLSTIWELHVSIFSIKWH
jgi:hypothetical protein